MQQGGMNNFMLGGAGAGNAGLPANLLGGGQMAPNPLQAAGFGGLPANLQNNPQIEALLRGFNMSGNMNMNNALQGLGKLGGGMGNLPK